MAIKNTAQSAGLAVDVKAAQELRSQFKTDPQAGIKSAAKEFEALFLQMVMKSMRATTSQDGLMDSEASRFFTGMLDQQMAKDLSQTGSIGLAELLEQQLSRQMLGANGKPASISSAPLSDLPLARPTGQGAGAALQGRAREVASMERTPVVVPTVPQTPKDFVDQMWPHAVEASRATGIPPQFLVAHAALESGWGKRDIRNEDGSPSYNLFGIKAGKSWQGKTAEITTTEYVDGNAVKLRDTFRAYGSYAESFQDYANLLRNSPRYGSVIGSQDGTEFARRLQQAGYATDPKYAEKLAGIINGPTLRQALIG